MEEQVLELLEQIRRTGQSREVLERLCRCACARLDGLMAQTVSPQDCLDSYLLAAAWIAADWLEQMEGGADITALTAGELSVQRRQGQEGRLYRRALEIMGPYLRDEGFVFQGVRG